MATKTITQNRRTATARPDDRVEYAEQERLRTLALERIYRLRRFKLHVLGFAVGAPLLGILWMLTEYYEEHTWPSRFASAPDVAGTWETWFFWVAGIWVIFLVVHALRAYFGPPVGPIGRYIRRPVPQAELDREVERLKFKKPARRGGGVSARLPGRGTGKPPQA